MQTLRLSVLDLCPVVAGQPASTALRDALALAQHVESLGYVRYWVAEHHSLAGIASASPEIIIGHIAQATQKIRVGSGGIMLPNHAALRIAEAFRTLEAFHPGRIDLGIGRAPGTGSATALALRREQASLYAEDFPQQVEHLRAFLLSHFIEGSRSEQVVAMPVGTTSPEIWMLGSSDQGARMAAEWGLPYAFAQHFSPLPAGAVLELYRKHFRPSATLQKPKAMVAVHVICGPTDELARAWALPSDIAFYRYRTSGRNQPLMTVADAASAPLTPRERAQLETMSFPKFVGSPNTVRAALQQFLGSLETTLEELMVLTMTPDLASRKTSYTALAQAMG